MRKSNDKITESLIPSSRFKPFIRIFIWIFLVSSLSSNSMPASAEKDQKAFQAKEFWSIQLENDFFAQSGDRYYTNGTQVSRFVTGNPTPILQNMADFFPFFQSNGDYFGVNFTVGQKIFTPENTQSENIIKEDRPYAGFLFASAALVSRIPGHGLFQSGNMIEFTLGIIGPGSLAGETQSNFHKFIGIKNPKGWDNQLKNELGLGIFYGRFWRIIRQISGPFEYGINPQLSGMGGNIYTYAAAGAMVRIGTQLDNDLSPPNIRPGFPGIASIQPDKRQNWYLFIQGESRVVARNIFLDGNTFRESHHVKKKPLVSDIQLGFVFRFENMRFSISSTYRTKEFTTQRQATRYGALNFSFAR